MKLSQLLLCLTLVHAFPTDPLRVLEVEEGSYIQARESDKLSLLRRGVKFIDVTSFPLLSKEDSKVDVPIYNYPKEINNTETIRSLSAQIDKQAMYDNLVHFTSFFSRYYKSASGYESALWLDQKIFNLTREIPPEILTVERYNHDGWNQFTIIVSAKGAQSEDVVVLGSHQDSMNIIFPSMLPAPGADDNGSGTVTNLEALRLFVTLLAQGQRPKNTVEFHFYSAEEGGLLGSLDVFTSYAEKGRKVTAMLQQDMTGYVQDPTNEHIGVITDHTTPQLTDFIKLIIDSYLNIPYRESECGYACSDHSSASKNGFPAAFVIESEISMNNRYIHTTMDTIDRLSLDHMVEHVKIALGYVIELGNWKFTLTQ
ncbi:YDR415C [Zygosaccharomyces parabailii]|nr:YDR415C [Zygosaccharomyces parabailii]SJM88667.1 probable Probable aminopeptidase YDR415C [Zygosaccharomyces bailii]